MSLNITPRYNSILITDYQKQIPYIIKNQWKSHNMQLQLTDWTLADTISTESEMPILIHKHVYNALIDWTFEHTRANLNYTQATLFAQNKEQAIRSRASDIITAAEQAIRSAINEQTHDQCSTTLKSFTDKGFMEPTITVTPARRDDQLFYLVHFGSFVNSPT